MRTDVRPPLAHVSPHTIPTTGGWLARRWYYTPKTRRAYSVRQVATGDRRLLAQFATALNESGADRDQAPLRELADMLFDRVLASGDRAVAFAALESTVAGDRVVGVASYAPLSADVATFSVAVAGNYRDEQVGRTLLSTLIRHAKRAGIRSLAGEMAWSNRPMQLLAQATGFTVEALPGDRGRRRLILALK